MRDRRMLLLRMIFPIFAGGFVAFIFWNSAQNGEESGQRSGGALEVLQKMFGAVGIPFPFSEHILRKVAHFLEYCGLGVLLTLTVRFYTVLWLPRVFIPGFFCLLVPVCDEFLQTFIPGRSGQMSDVLLDFSGAVTGIFLTSLVTFFVDRRSRRKEDLALWKY